MQHRRPRILGFGPIGYALLLPLAALIWVAWTGHDLRYDIMRMISTTLGWRALYNFVIYGITAHWFAFHTPHFGPMLLAGVLLVLHFAPRPLGASRYAAAVIWAVASPPLTLFLGLTWPSPPRWFPTWSPSPWIVPWFIAQHLLIGVGTVLCLWYITRSRGVALGALAAVLIIFPIQETVLARSIPPAGYFPNILWHAAIIALWVVREWRKIKPDYACQSCGYDLRGLAAPACPECGAAPATPPLPAPAAVPPPPAPGSPAPPHPLSARSPRTTHPR